MSRPQNSIELLEAAQKEYDGLEIMLAGLTPEQMVFTQNQGDWAVKDILAHLYEWQQMVLSWYESGLRGENPAVPARGFMWNQLPALNQIIYEKYRCLTPEQALSLFRQSHQKTIQFIETLSESDLTTPGLYKWMNQNTMMAYLNSTTAAHYVWACKEIKKIFKVVPC